MVFSVASVGSPRRWGKTISIRSYMSMTSTYALKVCLESLLSSVTPLNAICENAAFNSNTCFRRFQKYCGGLSLNQGLRGLQWSSSTRALSEWNLFTGHSLSVRRCAGNIRRKPSWFFLKANSVAWRISNSSTNSSSGCGRGSEHLCEGAGGGFLEGVTYIWILKDD